jgi:predicted RNA-binding Zn-ribbon protein involved in translation (DUF1610 family)
MRAWWRLPRKWRYFWWRLFHKPKPANPCPVCGTDMERTEKTSFSGNDMRTYCCPKCGHEEVVNYGIATWKAMSGDFGDE